MGVKLKGFYELERALQRKSKADFEGVQRNSILGIYRRSQQKGGTPVETSELRQSASYNHGEMGYTKDYGPHVEFGHITLSGSFVPGQYFLRANVEAQKPIYRHDLIQKIKE